MDFDIDLKTVERSAEIVAAYVAHNALSPADLPVLLRSVHSALTAINSANVASPESGPAERRAPAVSIRKSVTPEYLICLEDGLKFKSLKRHLQASFNMTPDQYRARWNLPADYPMVAAAYAAQRSSLAKSFGLGRKR